jgi:hypothetical protein
MMEKSSAIIKVPSLTAVYDVPAVAALSSVSSNPILLSTCRLHEQRRGTLPPPPWFCFYFERRRRVDVKTDFKETIRKLTLKMVAVHILRV